VGGVRRGAGAAGALAAIGVWAGFVEPRRLVIRRAELALPNWPAALDGVRVALLGDLHAGGLHKRPPRIRAIAERVAVERPDLVLLLGDFIDFDVHLGGRRESFADVAAALAPLTRPPLGCFAVLGNHDWLHGGRPMRRALEAEGVRVLENESVPAGDRGLWVAGVADLRYRRPDMVATLAAAPEGAPVILMVHDPDLWPHVPSRVALSVAAHTHGGQIAVPWLRLCFIPSRRPRRYMGGLVKDGPLRLWVTSGVGEAGVPVRLFRPPEAVLLTLRRRAAGP